MFFFRFFFLVICLACNLAFRPQRHPKIGSILSWPFFGWACHCNHLSQPHSPAQKVFLILPNNILTVYFQSTVKISSTNLKTYFLTTSSHSLSKITSNISPSILLLSLKPETIISQASTSARLRRPVSSSSRRRRPSSIVGVFEKKVSILVECSGVSVWVGDSAFCKKKNCRRLCFDGYEQSWNHVGLWWVLFYVHRS